MTAPLEPAAPGAALSRWGPLGSPYLLLIFTMMFWSANSVIARSVVETVPPMHLSFLRWLVALLILLPFAWRPFQRQWPQYRTNWRLILVLALFSVTLFNSLLYIAVQFTIAINISLVTTAIPAFTVLIAWAALREPISRRIGLGMAAAFFGVLVIVAKGDISIITEFDFNRGDLITMAAVFCWSVYSVLLRRLPKGLDPVGFMFAITLIGTIMIVPLFVIELGMGRAMTITPSGIFGIVYLGLFASILAFLFFNNGVKRLGANRATQFNYLMPFFGVALAMIFLGEMPRWFHGVGITLVLLGVWYSATKQAADQKT